MIARERPIQQKVVDDLSAMGWRPVTRSQMTELRIGRMGEPLVELLMVAALRDLNKGLTESEALRVVDQLRRLPDSETFLEALHDGIRMAFAPDEPTRIVTIVDWRNPSRNDYVVTTEFELRTGAHREPRLDVVLVLNGIPLAIVETKSPIDDWKRAARDFRLYWRDAPELERYAVVCVATNGFAFRLAPSGTRKVSQYCEWKDSWPHPMPVDGRELEAGLVGLLHPHNLVDIACNFVVFETREGVTQKKLARYQQYRAANKIVRRVLEGVHDRGIVWHTQGSGKSLTMVFTARKLKAVGLGNPTVFIVIDRIDLDDQINETFTSASFKGVQRAFDRRTLRELLIGDQRGVIITTVQKFDETMAELVNRDNVVVLVDEAHRSQEGQHGIRMRKALPRARLFAFTGTPIESRYRSTWRAFSPVIDGKYEDYLDVYTPKQAVEDGATVEVRYEPRLVEWQFRDADLDQSFDALAEDLTEEKRENLRVNAARLAVVAKAPERVESVAADVVEYCRSRMAPQGFKAQLVAVDREACALYADALLKAGMTPAEVAVIFTPDEKRDEDRIPRWYSAEQWRRVHGAAPLTTTDLTADEDTPLSVGEIAARRLLISNFKDPESPLKILIVTDMLLTGFDAPVEQVMFLDKPLKGAKLLQAIMRTNRPYPGKDRGIVVDYWGVFERLQEAFGEFVPEEVDLAVLDLVELRDRFPVLLAEALALVAALPLAASLYEQMVWLLRRFANDPENAELFEDRFQAVQSAFESLAPDPVLAPHLADYQRLVRLRAMWRRAGRLDQAVNAYDVDEYRPHTHRLVQDVVWQVTVRNELPIYRIDAAYADRIRRAPIKPEEKAAEVQTAIEFEIRERGKDDPVARSLSERLERLLEKKRQADADMLSLLDDLLQLANDWSTEKQSHADIGLSIRAQSIMSILRVRLPEGTLDDSVVDVAKRIDDLVERHSSFPGWNQRDDVIRDIRREILRLLLSDAVTRPLVQADFIDEVVSVVTADPTEEE